MEELPKEIVVYLGNRGTPYGFLGVSEGGLQDVPEDEKGAPVGIYQLVKKGTLRVEKSADFKEVR